MRPTLQEHVPQHAESMIRKCKGVDMHVSNTLCALYIIFSVVDLFVLIGSFTNSMTRMQNEYWKIFGFETDPCVV